MTVQGLPAGPVQGQARLAEALGAFSLAGDLGRGQPLGHSLRTCILALHIARELGLPAEAQADVYCAALLVHAGCTAGAPQFAAMLAGDELAAMGDMYLCDPGNMAQVLRWIARHTAPQSPFLVRTSRFVQAVFQAERTMADFDNGCSDVGARVAERLGLSKGTREGLFHICELWNGRGPHRLRGGDIPLVTRIVNASMVLEVFARAEGRGEAIAAAIRFRGRYVDPTVADAFQALAGEEDLWDSMALEDPWELVMAMEPGAGYQYVSDAGLEEALTALADFADFKSSYTAGHGREAAQLAEAVARSMGLPPAEVILARRAALVHHLGHVALPSFLLDKPGPLSAVEQEHMKLHPYYTHLILSRVPAFQPIAAIAGMHHQEGYSQGHSPAGIPAAARVVAVADAYLELTHDGPARRAVGGAEALGLIRQQVGTRFDGACLDALSAAVPSTASKASRGQEWPKDLTEREVEVLRLVSQGLSRRQAAQRLVVSEHTVRHHLESVYSKIGVSSRAGAVLFAVENGLLS